MVEAALFCEMLRVLLFSTDEPIFVLPLEAESKLVITK